MLYYIIILLITCTHSLINSAAKAPKELATTSSPDAKVAGAIAALASASTALMPTHQEILPVAMAAASAGAAAQAKPAQPTVEECTINFLVATKQYKLPTCDCPKPSIDAHDKITHRPLCCSAQKERVALVNAALEKLDTRVKRLCCVGRMEHNTIYNGSRSVEPHYVPLEIVWPTSDNPDIFKAQLSALQFDFKSSRSFYKTAWNKDWPQKLCALMQQEGYSSWLTSQEIVDFLRYSD